ncbi:MAG: hypothetical protein LBS46_09430 [Dysgonamonadaceae bacterium]|jgi:hypothetical protein|nr:hypothetical protein [Dysgonamonadaceae bacterium]
MTPKRMLYRGVIRFFEQMMLRRSFRSCHSIHLSVEPLPDSNRQCDLITVAFNNVKTIEQQIHFVRKYMGGENTTILSLIIRQTKQFEKK